MAECYIYTNIVTNADRIRAMSDEALAAFQTPTRYALQHREVLL